MEEVGESPVTERVTQNVVRVIALVAMELVQQVMCWMWCFLFLVTHVTLKPIITLKPSYTKRRGL